MKFSWCALFGALVVTILTALSMFSINKPRMFSDFSRFVIIMALTFVAYYIAISAF
jgi:hypothetical protein